MLNKRFEHIIRECQTFRDLHGFEYEEKCKEMIEEYSQEIKKKKLIEKCEDKTFAKQLCIANSLDYE